MQESTDRRQVASGSPSVGPLLGFALDVAEIQEAQRARHISSYRSRRRMCPYCHPVLASSAGRWSG